MSADKPKLHHVWNKRQRNKPRTCKLCGLEQRTEPLPGSYHHGTQVYRTHYVTQDGRRVDKMPECIEGERPKRTWSMSSKQRAATQRVRERVQVEQGATILRNRRLTMLGEEYELLLTGYALIKSRHEAEHACNGRQMLYMSGALADVLAFKCDQCGRVSLVSRMEAGAQLCTARAYPEGVH